MGLLLANGSMSSNTGGEGKIRQALIENDLVECMVALPGQLFTNTQIPACIWFLTKNKGERTAASGRKLRDRKNQVLFIDARNLGYMKDRVLRDFTAEDLATITDLYHNWRRAGAQVLRSPGMDESGQVEEGYHDIPGLVKSSSFEEIKRAFKILCQSSLPLDI